MSRSYSELNKLDPQEFLHPERFITTMDHLPPPGYNQSQYEKGLKYANESVEVGIGMNGTWFASGKDHSQTSSYEGIGYHSCTAELLRGLLSGTARFVVYRGGHDGAEGFTCPECSANVIIRQW